MTTPRRHSAEGPHRRRTTTREPAHGLAVRTAAPSPAALPLVDEFVGREREVAELAAMTAAHRLVTVTGPPGAGKSRLARHAALQGAQVRRLYVIDMDLVGDPSTLEAVVAAQLCVDAVPGADPIAVLAGQMKSSSHLIVLDNCEHLLDACAALVEKLLRLCDSVHLLATSREAIGVVGERVLALAPLPVPEAVELFCHRAVAVRREFVASPDTGPLIADICRRLDGLPLAVELAAGRLAVLSLPEVASGLDDRFTLLASAGRGTAQRHRGLRAAFDWSYDLLTASERVLLARLSVFAGGCTLDAAEEVLAGGEIHTDDVLELLNALVAKSLVVAETAHQPARYRLLESVRAYALGRLGCAGERAQVEARHARWCVQFLDLPAAEWLARFEAEEGNLSAALAWSVSDGRVRTVAKLVSGVVPLWWAQGRFGDAQRWLLWALRLKGRAPVPLRVKLLCDAALSDLMLGEASKAGTHAQDALDLATEYDDLRGMTESLRILGFTSTCEGDAAAGLRLIDEAVELARVASDRSGLSHALAARARVHLFQGRAQEGRRDFEAALTAARAVDSAAVVNARIGLGWAALSLGECADAQAHLEDALQAARQSGERHCLALALAWLGDLHRVRGQDDQARARLEEALTIGRPMATPYLLTRVLISLGRLGQLGNDRSGARANLDEALAVARQFSLPFLVAPCLVGLAELADAEGDAPAARRLLDEAVESARAFGDPAAEADAFCALGHLDRRAGDGAQTGANLYQSLTVRAQIGDRVGLADSLEEVAGLVAADDGSGLAAARLFGAAEAVRQAAGSVRPPWRQVSYDADVAQARTGCEPSEFLAAWEDGARLSIEDAVAYAVKGRGRRKRPAKGWEGLTPAERQVVELVVQGLTNPEVAARLFISAETVKAHLSRAFTKLGVRSRRELRSAPRENPSLPA